MSLQLTVLIIRESSVSLGKLLMVRRTLLAFQRRPIIDQKRMFSVVLWLELSKLHGSVLEAKPQGNSWLQKLLEIVLLHQGIRKPRRYRPGGVVLGKSRR